MMRSLYSGVAGLRTHQTKMDVLGNNIANVNTTSYKSQSITFSDLMYQTTQTASGASETKGGVNARQIGLGAKSGAISTAIESQGATQTTNNPFDIMITGSSFFIVNNGKENLYTRDGSFYVDGAGNLAMQSNGYFVQGWAAKEDKKTGEIQVDKNGDITSLQIMSADNATYSPASTTQALYSGNIDDHDTNVTSDDGKTITLEFYDNKGYLYTGKFTLKDTGTDHLFSLQLTDILDSDGNSINQEITLPDGTKTNRLDHVTFGETETVTSKIQDGYYIDAPTNDKTTIWREANSPVYDTYTIKSTGDSLDALLKIDGFLDEVYPLKGTTYKEKYGDITNYTISQDALTIVYTSEDAKISTDASKTYTNVSTSNEIPYFYNPTTHFGYAVPSSGDNPAYPLTGKLSTLQPEFVKDVYGFDVSTIDADKYNYSFNETSKELTIIANEGPTVTTGEVPTAGLGTKYDAYFKGTNYATDTISSLLAKIADGTSIVSPAGTAFTETNYTYSADGVLKITGKYLDNGNGNKNIQVKSEDTDLYNMIKANAKGSFSATDLTSNALADLEKTIGMPGLADNYKYTAVIDDSDPANPVVSAVKIDSVDASKIPYSTTVNSGDLFDQLKAKFDPTDSSAPTEITESASALSDDNKLVLQGMLDDYTKTFTFKYELDDASASNKEYTIKFSGHGYTDEERSVTTATGDKLVEYLSSISQTINIADMTPAQKTALINKLQLPDGSEVTGGTFTYKVASLTGTEGFLAAVDYTGTVEKTADIDTFTHTSQTKTADFATYEYGVPSSVFRNKNASLKEGYVLTGGTDGTYTLTQLKEQLGEDVLAKIYADGTTYDSLKGNYTSLSDDEFKVQLTGSRMIVSHVQTDTNNISSDYEAKVDSATGNVTYKTVNPTPIATDIPVSGKISDLLSSASGDYKGVLQKIFGISDDDARAYGSDGTYKIGEDLKSVELTTGTHTVMLKFDAANGSLVSANDNKLGKGLVNMVFDQSELYGMEAFGYQKGDNDPAEMVAGHMTFDFSSVTNYNTSGSSTVKAVKGDKKSLNTGRAVGEMNGVNISTDGRIYATYSNGQTKLLGQIASAQFANASGLSKEGDNLYSSTLNSGEATVQDITTDGGYMNTGVLEMSNVDLSREFTEMITTQRGFQANSRIITVSDTLLEELTNLKR
jgi:flagellar hook protein FlgE